LPSQSANVHVGRASSRLRETEEDPLGHGETVLLGELLGRVALRSWPWASVDQGSSGQRPDRPRDGILCVAAWAAFEERRRLPVGRCLGLRSCTRGPTPRVGLRMAPPVLFLEWWPVADRSAIEWTEATWNPTTGC